MMPVVLVMAMQLVIPACSVRAGQRTTSMEHRRRDRQNGHEGGRERAQGGHERPNGLLVGRMLHMRSAARVCCGGEHGVTRGRRCGWRWRLPCRTGWPGPGP